MPSSSAALAALASILVSLRQAGLFDEPRRAPSAPSSTNAPQLRGRECRLDGDVLLGPLRERALSLTLSARPDFEIGSCGLLILSVVGAATVFGRFVRCCCRCRRRRVSAIQLSFRDGAEGIDRRIARRRLA